MTRVGGVKMRLLQATGNNTTQRIYLKGDKSKKHEPVEFYIHVPNGSIGVCRCADGTYWAHVALDREGPNGEPLEQRGFPDSRIDCRDIPATKQDVGHLNRSDCYHVAVRFP